MKSFSFALTGLTTSLSLLIGTQAAPLSNGTLSNSTAGASCPAVQKTDESSYFSVVGVQGTGVHPRQELRELEQDAETWNIFLQAFARFQAMDQSDKVSYFQVAAPFGTWDGVDGDGMLGYCPHTSNVFLTWHRPYLALFEQVLQLKAVEIANEYPVGSARESALSIADRIRLPYWDWALDPSNSSEGVMPPSLRRQSATVTFPNGTMGEIPNPLFQYRFHPLNYDDFSALAEFEFMYWNTTIRLPDNGTSITAMSRNDLANKRATIAQPDNRDSLYKLLTTYQTFNQWSSAAGGSEIGSVEVLHNGMHNMFGMGNMGIVEASAYDPVFWFHHCQMDRLMAIYQYRYPDTWVEADSQWKGTYIWSVGSIQSATSPLKPFHMNALGDMWTSNLVRNWTSFGYTYPELASNPSNTTLTTTINKLYKSQTQGLDSSNTTDDGYSGAVTNNSAKATDWNAQVKMPADIQVSYSVRCFLGEPNADPSQWATDPNYIGQVAATSSPRMSSNVTFTANIRLTEKLYMKYQAGELTSLTDEAVSAYLEENFHWRIQALDYTEIPRSSPPKGLNVTVFNVAIEIPKDDTDVPEWTGLQDFRPEIKGNPPRSLSSVPLAGNTDGWNATSGTWHWSNVAEEEGDAQLPPSSSSTATLVTTPVGTVTPGPGEAVQVTTLPNGEKVTQIVTVVVTVTAGAESVETSSVSPTSTEAEVSTPVTTPVGTVTPGAGEAVEVVTLESGQKITKVVTVVEEVTVFLPAPTA
ncbi:Di-copper centre-containing protein [Bimuria novae-zelandiae CBS 107.79]|uniref:tyrosinase n=1 Tax=Bimuria novae-zelandiae CBS 107.79 TaxID=1447943 RepID=A0A6A5VK30_9PLEO|nr:Di-copper centre-containing protein [Bimuria novae-zelandiae CBS 107.79]